MTYDSRPDTYEHIDKVRKHVNTCAINLVLRGQFHDRSKLSGIEKDTFDLITPRLAGLEYGSDEYRQTIRDNKPGIDAHYMVNDHHPEHHPNGIEDMHLLQLTEMLCDWKAAGERHDPPNSIESSIAHNIERFGISEQLARILENTAAALGWLR